jgi:HD-GYP domain-containing protein (c-di-GMP phosphodiesterase class II)
LLKPSLNIVLDSNKNVQKKVIPSSTELMAKEIVTINNVKNENENVALVSPIEVNPIQEMIENLEQEETLTVKSFFIQKVNKVLYGMKDPNEDEKYASVSQRVSSATGISFDLKRRKNKEFHLKIGKFSIDRKKSK